MIFLKEKRIVLVLLGCLLWIGCSDPGKRPADGAAAADKDTLTDASPVTDAQVAPPVFDYDRDRWQEFQATKELLQLDIKYATADNFTKQQIYPCARCFLAPKAAAALTQVMEEAEQRGYQLVLFDCYRPRPAQQKLWDIVPDARYVTPPAKGSMHNRGLAVDISLADASGVLLDMGTAYDSFTPASWSTHVFEQAHINANRKLLRSMMEAAGFKGIRTEWWHFSYPDASVDLADWEWGCE